jgi:hypothetical protein
MSLRFLQTFHHHHGRVDSSRSQNAIDFDVWWIFFVFPLEFKSKILPSQNDSDSLPLLANPSKSWPNLACIDHFTPQIWPSRQRRLPRTIEILHRPRFALAHQSLFGCIESQKL